jgi:hypothetical protein
MRINPQQIPRRTCFCRSGNRRVLPEQWEEHVDSQIKNANKSSADSSPDRFLPFGHHWRRCAQPGGPPSFYLYLSLSLSLSLTLSLSLSLRASSAPLRPAGRPALRQGRRRRPADEPSLIRAAVTEKGEPSLIRASRH